MAKPALMALDGGDPRLSAEEGTFAGQGMVAYTRPQMRALHDPSVSFEEYFFHAQQTRAEEDQDNLQDNQKISIMSVIFPAKSGKGAGGTDGRRKSLVPHVNTSEKSQRATISDEEWANASRAVRTASKGAVFYLITTDILGPFGLPVSTKLLRPVITVICRAFQTIMAVDVQKLEMSTDG